MKTTTQGRKKLYVLFTLCAVLILLVSGQYYGRIDFTNGKRFSVSDISKNILNEITEPLRITYYVSGELKNIYPQVRDISDFLYAYAAENKLVTVTIVDPASRNLEKTLAVLGIPGRQISSAKKNKTELITVYSAIIIEYLEKTAIIPFILSADTLEYELTGRIMPLAENRVRNVFLMAGNGFSVEKDYSYAVPWLESAGFTCTVLEPAEFVRIQAELSSGTESRIPLIIFGSDSLTQEEAAAIESFAASGGNIFFAVSPNTADIYGGWQVSTPDSDHLLPVLDTWGFGFSNGLVADSSCFRMTLYSDAESPVYEYRDYPLWVIPQPQNTSAQSVSKATGTVTFFWASPLTLSNPVMQPIFKTTPDAWLSLPDYTKTPPFVTSPFLLEANGINGSARKHNQYTLAAEYTGPVSGYYTAAKTIAEADDFFDSDASIVIVADQYFVSTIMLDYTGSSGNLDFLVNAALYLSKDFELLSLRNKASGVQTLQKIAEEQLVSERTKTILITAVFIPLLCIAIGLTYIFIKAAKQRKKYFEGNPRD